MEPDFQSPPSTPEGVLDLDEGDTVFEPEGLLVDPGRLFDKGDQCLAVHDFRRGDRGRGKIGDADIDMGDVLRVAADEHKPSSEWDGVCGLRPVVVVFDETTALWQRPPGVPGRPWFLRSSSMSIRLLSSAARSFPCAVDVSVSRAKMMRKVEPDFQSPSILTHCLSFAASSRICGDRFGFRPWPARTKGLEAFGVRHLGRGYLAHGGFSVVHGGYWPAGRPGLSLTTRQLRS